VTRFFDIRLPIGALCVVLGALLVGYGWLGHATKPITLDIYWGGVVFAFGIAMLGGAWWAGRGGGTA